MSAELQEMGTFLGIEVGGYQLLISNGGEGFISLPSLARRMRRSPEKMARRWPCSWSQDGVLYLSDWRALAIVIRTGRMDADRILDELERAFALARRKVQEEHRDTIMELMRANREMAALRSQLQEAKGGGTPN